MYSISGGSRIFLGGGRGAPTPKVDVPTYFFPENCMKMKQFGPPGGRGRRRVPGASPLDVPISIDLKIESDLRYDSLGIDIRHTG